MSPRTASAIAQGIEVEMFKPLTNVKLDLEPTSLDRILVDRGATVKAPSMLREAGIDYTISRPFDENNKDLYVTLNFKTFEGFDETGKEIIKPPKPVVINTRGKTIAEIQSEVNRSALQAYTNNYLARQQSLKNRPQTGLTKAELDKKLQK